MHDSTQETEPQWRQGAEPRWRVVFVFCLLTIGLYVAAGPLVRLSEWRIWSEPGLEYANQGMAEALAWREGRLDLATGDQDASRFRMRDTAYRDGKVYNVFPPLFSFISYAVLGLQDFNRAVMGWVGIEIPSDAGATEFPWAWYVGLAALPLPLLGFWAFRCVTSRSEWAAVMTAYWILGTPLLKMLVNCQRGSLNELNHVLSNAGLMLIGGDLLGRRRIWPAAIGLVIACWSRQLTVLYGLAVVIVAWRLWQRPESEPADERSVAAGRSWTKLAICMGALVLAVGGLAGLNWAKFGSPLDTGYASIYDGREDMYARRARQFGRPFDPRFVPLNAFHMNVSVPEVGLAGHGVIVTGDSDGTAIWLTCPLLLLAFTDVKLWWRDPVRRSLMLASLLVIIAFLCYHNTGSVQRGYFRFALDFVPVWLLVIAPWTETPSGRRWFTLGCLAYSLLYFHLLCASNA